MKHIIRKILWLVYAFVLGQGIFKLYGLFCGGARDLLDAGNVAAGILVTVAACVISALLFGFIHITSPGATVWSSIAIAVEAGVLETLVYKRTGSLWTAIVMSLIPSVWLCASLRRRSR